MGDFNFNKHVSRPSLHDNDTIADVVVSAALSSLEHHVWSVWSAQFHSVFRNVPSGAENLFLGCCLKQLQQYHCFERWAGKVCFLNEQWTKWLTYSSQFWTQRWDRDRREGRNALIRNLWNNEHNKWQSSGVAQPIRATIVLEEKGGRWVGV